MSTPSPDALELRAAEERRRLHSSAVELKEHLRETLDLKRNARQHLQLLASTAAVFSFMMGYVVTGVFTRR
jgi:hypothetical protein